MFQLITLLSLIIFVIYLLDAIKTKQTHLLFLAIIFATLFENASVILSAGQAGGYFYNQNFNLFIYKTPLFIILLWSVIVYSTQQIIGRTFNSKTFLFLAPIYILSLDIVLDQVATRLGLWTWIGFESYEGLFSVPAANYIGWMLLPFFFFVTYEKLKNKKYFIIQPFVAFLLYLLFSLPLYILKINFFNDNVFVQFCILIIIVIIFVILASHYYQKKESTIQKNPKLFVVRIFLHLFSISGIFYLGLATNYFLWLLICFIFVFEFWIYRKYIGKLKIEWPSSTPSKK